uniref:Uncharacterized protein n=1 Tax=Romanomermis culicivorax TaxID=13658 RepID=A0A915I1P6_ROMCU
MGLDTLHNRIRGLGHGATLHIRRKAPCHRLGEFVVVDSAGMETQLAASMATYSLMGYKRLNKKCKVNLLRIEWFRWRKFTASNGPNSPGKFGSSSFASFAGRK